MNIPTDWTFERGDIATAFDRHVREQLPWYDLATGMVAHVVRHYLPHGGLVYDLGASTGNIGRSLIDVLKQRDAQLVAVESSAAMADAYDGPGRMVHADITDMALEPCDVVVLFLTLQFIAVADRRSLLERIIEALRPGGALLVVDKEAPPAGYVGAVLRHLTIAGKVATGTTAEDVVAKELSLGGVQRPIAPGLVGGVEIFRFGEFVGYLREVSA